MDLAEFLLARIAEDEAAAREANGRVAWLTFREPDGSMRYTTVAHQHHGHEEWIADGHVAASAGVFVFYDSARVLAECGARRAIVDEHKLVASTTADGIVGCDRCGWHTYSWGPELTEDGPCLTLRLLALPYADHESYREEWKP